MKYLLKILWLFVPRMPVYSGARSGFTPALTDDNWTLTADTAGDVGKVLAIGWGGELTASAGYHTRWVRPTTAGITQGTALTAEDHHPSFSTPLCAIGHNWTTEPVLPAEPTALHNQNWNAHGGMGYIVLPLASPWILINGVLQGQLSCRNLSGVDANGSSYTVTWEE